MLRRLEIFLKKINLNQTNPYSDFKYIFLNYSMSDVKQHNYRILVLGAPGSGKSTLTRRLSMSLQTEAIHLDKYYWKPNWVETESEVWDFKINKLLNKESWIMDGNYITSLSERIKYATHIVYLDIPWYTSVYRIIMRMIKYRNNIRPDMHAECKERFNLEFIQFLIWVIKFNFCYKNNIIDILSDTKYEALHNAMSLDKWEKEHF